MIEHSTRLFIYENDSFSVQELLIPLYNNLRDVESILPMESPSDETVKKLNALINA
ncbi:MAG TPA: hypothetical protein VJ946_02715 [Bacteroidales bacterium]|nr:hypothetical protein [Bacteroidales bacterium]